MDLAKEPAWSYSKPFIRKPPAGSPIEKDHDIDPQKARADGKTSARGKNKSVQGSCGQRIPARKTLRDSETHPKPKKISQL